MNELDSKKINESINTLNKILKIVLIFFIILLTYILLLINKELKITSFLLIILKISSPLFIGILLACLLNPIVNKFKIKRIYSSLVIYFVIVIMIILFLWLIIPNLKIQIIDINIYQSL